MHSGATGLEFVVNNGDGVKYEKIKYTYELLGPLTTKKIVYRLYLNVQQNDNKGED